MSVEFGNTGKIVPKRFTLDEIQEASDNMSGFCLACGSERESCEPDARRYKCEDCGRHLVFGAEEIVLMGYVKS
ncbi:MAG: hypothetical protein WBO09_01715 [Methylocystis silviterrae]|uniref:hypothetical protein n=1 Tax=Methylocystis silviterrae TaxID=2743612 RepID=UPI003C785792